jgi:translation initiation factor 1
VDRCTCREKKIANSGMGVRIRREVKGRKGKTITRISGLPLNDISLLELAREMKTRCGTGGTVKDGDILIQGDHRTTLKRFLEAKGYRVKLAGG